jgi:hypothetical protein
MQFYVDYLANPSDPQFASIDPSLKDKPASETLSDKAIEAAFMKASDAGYKQKVWPGTACMRRLGNTYTASLYACLASLVDNVGADLLGKRIGMFSYGSGLASSFFVVQVKRDPSELKRKLDLQARLDQMQVVPCEDFVAALKVCSVAHRIPDSRWAAPGGKAQHQRLGAGRAGRQPPARHVLPREVRQEAQAHVRHFGGGVIGASPLSFFSCNL